MARIRISQRWVVPALLTSVVVVLVAGAGAAAAESNIVPTYWRGLWWALSQMTTVGFIGEPPETVPGALLSVVLMVMGFLLLANPGYSIPTVVRVLHFASASHLSGTARRIANVPTSGLGGLGPRGVLAAFVRGNTRSRL